MTDRELTTSADNQGLNNIKNREQFIKMLSEKPSFVEKQNGADGIPISYLEHELDEVYMGMWSCDNFNYQVIANEIVGTLELKVFDPSAKAWITRIGTAAVMIRQTSGADITDISKKIKNTLQMDFPKLKSMCIKNAAKSLGKRFGRDLNRKFEDEYTEIYTNELEYGQVEGELTKKLMECDSMDKLVEVYNSYPELHKNNKFKQAFTAKKTQLSFKK